MNSFGCFVGSSFPLFRIINRFGEIAGVPKLGEGMNGSECTMGMAKATMPWI
jgi:hypothetical protein